MSTPWFVNIDAVKRTDPHWLGYSIADAKKIEAAWNKIPQAPLVLNSNYLIDFTLMRQVRREDSDRWRLIKRGGSASDPAPVPADEEIDEAEAAALAKRAAAQSAAEDEAEDEEDTAAVPSPKKMRDRAMTAAIAPLPAPAAALSAASTVVLSLQAQLAEVEAELTKSEAERDIAVKKLEVAAAKSAALRADLLNSETDREQMEERYAALIAAIKPVAAAFGLNPDTPIGRAIAQFDNPMADVAPAASAASAAAAASPVKAASKKRSQEEEKAGAEVKPSKKAK